MKSSVIRKYALAALCGAAMFGVGQSAQAATWDIILGVPSAPTGTVTYNTIQSEQNVVNSPLAGNNVNDPSGTGATIFQNSNLQATFVGSYNVEWYYVGSESVHVNDFGATGVANANGGLVGYAEFEANNQCGLTCGLLYVSPQTGRLLMGTALDQTAIQPVFQFRDHDGSGVFNGSNVCENCGPNFFISYATLGPGGILNLSAAVSDWVVFGYNDTGSADDNHDDFIVAAHISDGSQVPIPAALPLFASVLGGGYLFRRLRNRRQAKAAA